MKKAMYFTAMIALTGVFISCNGQNVKVPQKAKKAFAQKYAKVKNPSWEKENGNYEGNWKVNGIDHSALFSPKGKFVGSETDIKPNQLPKVALNYLAKNGGDEIDEASLNKDAQGKITYEADVEGSTFLFDQSGKFIKKSKNEEGEQGENAEENE